MTGAKEMMMYVTDVFRPRDAFVYVNPRSRADSVDVTLEPVGGNTLRRRVMGSAGQLQRLWPKGDLGWMVPRGLVLDPNQHPEVN